MSEKETHQPAAAEDSAAEIEDAAAPATATSQPPADRIEEGDEPATDESGEPEPTAEPTAEAELLEGDTTSEAGADSSVAEASGPEPQGNGTAEKGSRERRGKPRLKLDELEVGVETQGKVMATAKFGVFVDIGAVTDGLVHVSEFPKRRFKRVEDVVDQGDVVDVWIKDIDIEGNRISLSMRKKPTRPMSSLETGAVLSGQVTSVTKYGAFVEIGSETEGLVHISEMSSGFVEKPAEIVSVGDSVEVRVKEIDRDRERISLSMVGLANDLGFESASQGPTPEPESSEPVERMPTVVELALRKALSDMQEADEEPAQVETEPEVEAEDVEPEEPESEPEADRTSLGEVYERMLEEYRETKKDE